MHPRAGNIVPAKTSRLQSTLDREIYSKAPDTSYLQASDTREVFEESNKRKNMKPSSVTSSPKSSATSSPKISSKLVMSEPVNRGMLNFSLQVGFIQVGWTVDLVS